MKSEKNVPKIGKKIQGVKVSGHVIERPEIDRMYYTTD
jgi:hypothetical protein